MAEIVLTRIQFVANNTYGTFASGDFVEVKMVEGSLINSTNIGQPTSVGIVVYKNGGQITVGADIDPDMMVSRRFPIYPQICLSTNYVEFVEKTDFPYVGYYTIPDHPACAITPVVCNLEAVGTPVVTLPSSATAQDGSITVTGQSSNGPIQYNLGSDFLYPNGQSSGTFTGLAYGTYRIYMRDSKNCSTSVLVSLIYNPSYGPKYRMDYDDLAGNKSRLDISEKEYNSTTTEICGGGVPVQIQLRGEGETHKLTPILSTQINATLMSETESEFISLYTSDPNKYFVKFYKDTGAGFNLMWTGRILPFSYQELHKAPPYEIGVTATDGIAELRDFSFLQTDGSTFSGTMKLIKIIAYCLQQTRILLNIRVGANIYATGMNTAASDDPLDQAYADVEAIYLSGKIDCLSVIEMVLRPFGAQIRQWNNVWNITRVEEMGALFDYREFDYNGDYVSNSSFDGVLDIVYPNTVGDVYYEAFPNKEIKNGYGLISAVYKLGVKKNMLGNGDFKLTTTLVNGIYVASINREGWTLVNDPNYALIEGYEAIEGTNVALTLQEASVTDNKKLGRAYLLSDTYNVKMGVGNTLKIVIRTKVEIPDLRYVQRGGASWPYVKVRVKVKYGSLYLKADGTWTATENIVSFFLTEYNKYIENEIIAKYPTSGTPLDGMDFVVTVYHGHAYYADATTVQQVRDLDTVGVPLKVRTEYNDGTKIYYYELEELTEGEALPDIIDPHDYNVSTNAVKWVLKGWRFVINDAMTFYIDRITMNFLSGGDDILSEITRSAVGENGNTLAIQDELYFGSKPEVITTGVTNAGVPTTWRPTVVAVAGTVGQTVTTNMPSFDLVYAGWLRDANGNGWEIWTRDGVSEEEKLHGIYLKMMVAQYKQSWLLMRARLNSMASGVFIGMMSSFRDVNDGNRIYIPISGTLDDKNCIFDGELLETLVIGVNGNAGDSDGSGTSPFSNELTNEFSGDFSG